MTVHVTPGSTREIMSEKEDPRGEQFSMGEPELVGRFEYLARSIDKQVIADLREAAEVGPAGSVQPTRGSENKQCVSRHQGLHPIGITSWWR